MKLVFKSTDLVQVYSFNAVFLFKHEMTMEDGRLIYPVTSTATSMSVGEIHPVSITNISA